MNGLEQNDDGVEWGIIAGLTAIALCGAVIGGTIVLMVMS